MDKILRTELLEYEKSAFIVDLMQHTSGKQYISITQIIYNQGDNSRKIKINEAALGDLLNLLGIFQSEMSQSIKSVLVKESKSELYLTNTEKEIQSRYLKGVPIKELGLQFNCTANDIITILQNCGLPIVTETKPRIRWKRKKRK